jgi:hypothetical protein
MSEEAPLTGLHRRIEAIIAAIISYQKERASHEKSRAKNDKKVLTALRFAAGFSAAAFIAAGIADVVFYRSMIDARIASTNQFNEMQADRRPWIATEITGTSDLTHDQKNLTLFAQESLRNTGKTPARDVSFHFDMIPILSDNNTHIDLKEYCNNYATGKSIDPKGIMTIY